MAIVLPYDIKEFTSNVVINDVSTGNTKKYEVTGDGTLDIIMNTVTKHLKAQYDSGSINKETYTTAYVQLMQAAMQIASQIWLQKPISDAQVDSENAKTLLLKRQAKGFDDDAKQKVLKILLDSWSIAFSVAKDNADAAIPESITKFIIDNLTKNIIIDSDLGDEPDGSIGLNDNPYSDYADTDTRP